MVITLRLREHGKDRVSRTRAKKKYSGVNSSKAI